MATRILVLVLLVLGGCSKAEGPAPPPVAQKPVTSEPPLKVSKLDQGTPLDSTVQILDAAPLVDAHIVDAAPSVDAATKPPPGPLALELKSPARGARYKKGPIPVQGRVLGGNWPRLKVNGERVRPAADGTFLVKVPQKTPGLALFDIDLRDRDDKIIRDRRGVLVGAEVLPTSSIGDAVHVRIGAFGLLALGKKLVPLLAKEDLLAHAQKAVRGGFKIQALTVDKIEVDLRPAEGYLTAKVTLFNVKTAFSAHRKVVGVQLNQKGTATAKRVIVRTRLKIETDGRGGLRIQATRSAVKFNTFKFHLNHVPVMVERWAHKQAQRALEKAAAYAVAKVVVRPLKDVFKTPRTFKVLGQTVGAKLAVESVLTTRRGVDLRAQITLSSRSRRRQKTKRQPLALRPQTGPRRNPGLSQGFNAAVSLDVLNRLLHLLWMDGAFDRTLTGDSLGIEALTVGMLQMTMGGAGWSNLGDPLTIHIQTPQPPVSSIVDRAVQLNMTDVEIILGDKAGPIVTLAARVTLGLDVVLPTATAAKPKLKVKLKIDLIKAHREPIDPSRVASFADLVGPIITHLIKTDTIELPLPDGIKPRRARVITAQKAGWIGIAATL